MTSYDSPFIKIVDNNAAKTIVYFSSVNVPEGKFNGTNVVDDIDANCVFLNCQGNSWYLDGIPGIGTCIEEVSKTLKNIVDQLNGEDKETFTLYFGGSMGGYGALLYGCLNNADRVIGTGVEVDLLKKDGYASNLSKFDFESIDLPDFLSIVSNTKANIDLVFGENSAGDYYDISPLCSFSNVTSHSIPNCGHKVPVALNNSIGMKNFINEALLGKNPFNDVDGALCKYPFVLNSLSGLIKFDPEVFVEMLKKRRDLDSSVKALMHHKLGEYFHVINVQDALYHYQLAIHFNPAFYSSYLNLSKLHLKERNIFEFRKNIDAAINLIKINNTDSLEYLYYLLARGLVEFNKMKDALLIIDTELRSVDSSTPLGKLIQTLIEKTDGK